MVKVVLKLWSGHKNLHAYFLCLGYNQSYGSCVLHVASRFNISVTFHENMSSNFKLMELTQKLLTNKQTQKVGKPELRFMCSACRLMVFNICVKFHENMSSGFKVMERTWKLLTPKGQ